MIHIVICDNKENELEKLIKKERKVLLRGNSTRRVPHSRIFVNDELYFLNRGETEIKYHAVVKNADCYSKLTNNEIENIFIKYKDNLNLSISEEKKWKKKCLCVIDFENFDEIETIPFSNYTNLEDWIMLNDLKELENR